MSQEIMFYGAKALAYGMYKAIERLYPEVACKGFVVRSLGGNMPYVEGNKVWRLEELYETLTPGERNDRLILIATPENLHKEIVRDLGRYGFNNYICMNSHREAKLMQKYFETIGEFPSIHGLRCGETPVKAKVLMSKFYRDTPLVNRYDKPEWVKAIQVGAGLTDARISELMDNTGDNISLKNVNYCELTALYWLWKNELCKAPCSINETGEVCGSENEPEFPAYDYYGLYHYRRILDINEEDLYKIKENDIDVILQFPTLHYPDIDEHHRRYINESDWEAMFKALSELQPEYARVFPDIFRQQYFYNYNLIFAKKDVLAGYCAWLFPILERTEELSNPKGFERADRYIGYLGENLMTLYFLHNKDRLNIYHTGRLMLI